MNAQRIIGAASPVAWRRRPAGWFCATACFALLAVAVGTGLVQGYAQELIPLPAYDPAKSTSTSQKSASTPQESTASQGPASGQQQQPPAVSAPADAPKQGVAGECSDLLKMAAELKTEVDKTTMDMLSVTVVRKAGELEQLAHKVRTGAGRN